MLRGYVYLVFHDYDVFKYYGIGLNLKHEAATTFFMWHLDEIQGIDKLMIRFSSRIISKLLCV